MSREGRLRAATGAPRQRPQSRLQTAKQHLEHRKPHPGGGKMRLGHPLQGRWSRLQRCRGGDGNVHWGAEAVVTCAQGRRGGGGRPRRGSAGRVVTCTGVPPLQEPSSLCPPTSMCSQCHAATAAQPTLSVRGGEVFSVRQDQVLRRQAAETPAGRPLQHFPPQLPGTPSPPGLGLTVQGDESILSLGK